MFARRLAALVALVGLVAACTAGPGTGGEIEGIQWVLRSYDQAGTLTIVPDTVFADAQFSSYQVSGSSGCNSYKALYQAGGRTLIVGNPSVTLMACDKATMDFEQTFLTLLQSSRFYGVQRDTLTVWNADRTNILVFDAAPRNPLLGRWQVDSFATPSGSVSVPIAGTSLEVTFGLLNVSGFSGCNSFSGTYSTNGNVVRIGGLASTRIACPQDVMDQELAFLAALQGVAFIDYQGSTVLLEDRNNRIQVALVQPQPEASPSGSPSIAPTPGPTASPSAGTTPTPGPTATPTVAPTATPTATRPSADDRAEPGTIGFVLADPTLGNLRPRRTERRPDRRQDRLPGRLVHPDRAGRPRLPLLRPAADHGADRSDHAPDRGHGLDLEPGLRRRRDRRHRSDEVDGDPTGWLVDRRDERDLHRRGGPR